MPHLFVDLDDFVPGGLGGLDDGDVIPPPRPLTDEEKADQVACFAAEQAAWAKLAAVTIQSWLASPVVGWTMGNPGFVPVRLVDGILVWRTRLGIFARPSMFVPGPLIKDRDERRKLQVVAETWLRQSDLR